MRREAAGWSGGRRVKGGGGGREEGKCWYEGMVVGMCVYAHRMEYDPAVEQYLIHLTVS